MKNRLKRLVSLLLNFFLIPLNLLKGDNLEVVEQRKIFVLLLLWLLMGREIGLAVVGAKRLPRRLRQENRQEKKIERCLSVIHVLLDFPFGPVLVAWLKRPLKAPVLLLSNRNSNSF